MVETRGRSLVSSHWGSYVLFLRPPGSSAVHVFRSPMGSLPCFWTDRNGVSLLFSNPRHLVDASLVSLDVNWDHIRAQSIGGDYLGVETGISGVFSLIPGECLEFCAGTRLRQTYWSPKSVRTDEAHTSIETAAATLRSATAHAIDSVASAHETLLVTLSGGFDSSVVLSYASSAPTRPRVIGVNFHSRHSGDERRYARSMSQNTGTQLVEVQLSSNAQLARVLSCSLTASPVPHLTAFETEPVLLELADANRATGILTGQLGDDVFGHAHGPEMLVDCMAQCHLGRYTFLAFLDYATLQRISLLRALSLALAFRRRWARSSSWSFYEYRRNTLGPIPGALTTDAAVHQYENTLPRFLHPWLQDTGEMALGRIQSIHSMICATSRWIQSGFSEVTDGFMLRPLASQPIVEAALRIPTYLHFSGGQNGAVARRAFGSRLSQEVLQRGKGKGTPELWMSDLLSQNSALLRETLLDGLLVGERILDRSRVERALTPNRSLPSTGVGELINQLQIEAWLRQWATKRRACGSPILR